MTAWHTQHLCPNMGRYERLYVNEQYEPIKSRCPSCMGQGKLSQSQADERLALIPLSDKRLRPRHTKLYLTITFISVSLLMLSVGFVFWPYSIDVDLLDAKVVEIYMPKKGKKDMFYYALWSLSPPKAPHSNPRNSNNNVLTFQLIKRCPYFENYLTKSSFNWWYDFYFKNKCWFCSNSIWSSDRIGTNSIFYTIRCIKVETAKKIQYVFFFSGLAMITGIDIVFFSSRFLWQVRHDKTKLFLSKTFSHLHCFKIFNVQFSSAPDAIHQCEHIFQDHE